MIHIEQAGRQAVRQTDGQREGDRQTDTETEKETETDTETDRGIEKKLTRFAHHGNKQIQAMATAMLFFATPTRTPRRFSE